MFFSNLKVRLTKALVFASKSRVFSMDGDMSSCNWRGVPISEIIGSQSPWGAPEFPLVTPGHNHTVLYHIPSCGDLGDRPPKLQIGQEKWDSEHVRMPCSSKSLYPVEDVNGETHLRKRWEMIEDALRRPILDSHQLADAILSYNTKFKTIWKFRALHHLFNDHLDEEESQYFFTVTLPQIGKLALDLPKLIQAPIPLLKQHKNHSISLTQLQMASLLANAFFCTFPRRNSSKRSSEYASYPHINFSALYECAPHDDIIEKLICLCHYFRRVCTKAPRGVATFSRRSVAPRACPAWARSDTRIAALPVHVDPDGRIEDAHGLIQLDFANKYLGGGVLGHGSVQEEIRFAICPELMMSMLFTEVLRPNEALLMIGCERYSQYSGYGRSFRWAGNFSDCAPADSAGRRRVAVLAVDAQPYADPRHEYRSEMVTRELHKAWVGFTFFTDDNAMLQYPGIATGNWGCGAFGGSPELKSLLQMMACAEARRPMAYYTFGDNEIRDQVINMYNLLARHDVTVGQLYQYLCRFSNSDVGKQHLHSFLQQAIIDDANKLNQSEGSLPREAKQPNQSESSHRSERQSARRAGLVTGDVSQSQCRNTCSPRLQEQNQQKENSPRVECMDTSSLRLKQNSSLVQKELLDDSPDLFSQEDEQEKKQDSQATQIVNNDEIANDYKMAASKTKMTPQTKRLFNELEKLDQDNGKLNLKASDTRNNATSKYFHMPNISQDILKSSDSEIEENSIIMPSSSQDKMASDHKMADKNKKMASDHKMANKNKMAPDREMADGNRMAPTSSRLFDEMQKLDDTHGRLNLTSPHSSLLDESKNVTSDCNRSMDCDKAEVSPEVKKKIARKITDYFTKKSS